MINRRNFIKTTGAASIAPFLPNTTDGEEDDSKELIKDDCASLVILFIKNPTLVVGEKLGSYSYMSKDGVKLSSLFWPLGSTPYWEGVDYWKEYWDGTKGKSIEDIQADLFALPLHAVMHVNDKTRGILGFWSKAVTPSISCSEVKKSIYLTEKIKII